MGIDLNNNITQLDEDIKKLSNNIVPMYDTVIVKRKEAEAKKGAIYLSNTTKSCQGIVICIGPGRLLDDGSIRPMAIKVGDLVLFDDGYSVKSKKINGIEFLIMRESDILAKLATSDIDV